MLQKLLSYIVTSTWSDGATVHEALGGHRIPLKYKQPEGQRWFFFSSAVRLSCTKLLVKAPAGLFGQEGLGDAASESERGYLPLTAGCVGSLCAVLGIAVDVLNQDSLSREGENRSKKRYSV